MSNRISDFNRNSFKLVGFCSRCCRCADIPRAGLDPGLTIAGLINRLRCRRCGGSNCSLRIIYAGAGEFHYGPG